jgi:hypothetical protein
MAAFEAEYRLPLWREGMESKIWQVWKRLGLAGFINAAQVFHEASETVLKPLPGVNTHLSGVCCGYFFGNRTKLFPQK